MDNYLNNNDYMTCPYNASHRILKLRIQCHLSRCRKQYASDLVTCPFNVTHQVPKQELDLHIVNCDSRSFFDNSKNTNKGTIKPTVPPAFKPVECSENWNDDPIVPSYDPHAYCERAPVLRKIQGVPPQERKQFRQQENKRLQELFNKKNEQKK